MDRRAFNGGRSFDQQSCNPFIPGVVVAGLVTGAEVDDRHLHVSDEKLCVWTELGFVVYLSKSLPNDFDVRVVLADVELVESLVADVVSHVFDDEQDRRFWIADDIPGLTHRVAKTSQRVVLWELSTKFRFRSSK